jgi:ubiquitin thioesterase OTU1
MRLRIRTPFATFTIENNDLTDADDDHDTLFLLVLKIKHELKESLTNQKISSLRFGTPLKVIDCAEDALSRNDRKSLRDLGITDGETLTVTFRDDFADGDDLGVNEGELFATEIDHGKRKNEITAATDATDAVRDDDDDDLESDGKNEKAEGGLDFGFDEEAEAVARAVERSIIDESDRLTSRANSRPEGYVEDDVDDGLVAVRKVIDADNSCLFNAIGYIFFRSLHKAKELRKIVADSILDDEETFSEIMLGRPPKEYAEWILKPNSWGGQTELYVLSLYLGKQIAAYDVQTSRCDVYGDCYAITERGCLLYDGLHYDALVFAYKGLEDNEDCYVTCIDTVDALKVTQCDRKAKALAEKFKQMRLFTDTANFSLRCLVCQEGLVGENEAREHARSTGHQNFGEF